jgi:hypothetical protein
LVCDNDLYTVENDKLKSLFCRQATSKLYTENIPFLSCLEIVLNLIEPLVPEVIQHIVSEKQIFISFAYKLYDVIKKEHDKNMIHEHAAAEKIFLCPTNPSVVFFLSCLPSCREVLTPTQLTEMSLCVEP